MHRLASRGVTSFLSFLLSHSRTFRQFGFTSCRLASSSSINRTLDFDDSPSVDLCRDEFEHCLVFRCSRDFPFHSFSFPLFVSSRILLILLGSVKEQEREQELKTQRDPLLSCSALPFLLLHVSVMTRL